MGLDYTDGCVNFRDVGEFLALITGTEFLPKGKLFRGGSIDYVRDSAEIGNPASIFNLRNGFDPAGFLVDYYHFPMSNKIEKYDTGQKEVRQWLNEIIGHLGSSSMRYPVLVHCLSGKDRTGIVIGAILAILGYQRDHIIEEYLLSEGEVRREWIEMALDGIGDPEAYFNRVDLLAVRENLLAE